MSRVRLNFLVKESDEDNADIVQIALINNQSQSFDIAFAVFNAVLVGPGNPKDTMSTLH